MIQLSRRSVIPRIAFVTTLTAFWLAISTFAPLAPASHRSGLLCGSLKVGCQKADVPANCYHVFIDAIRTDNATGTFNCLAPGALHEREALFVGNGWNSDADIQVWIHNFHQADLYLSVKEYAGNPTTRCAANAQQTAVTCHVAYLVYLLPYLVVDQDTPPDYSMNSNPELPQYVVVAQRASGLTFTLDSSGRIIDIA